MIWSESTPLPGRYPPDGRTPTQAMAAIRHAPVEIGYGYDAGGQQRFIQVGDANGIVGFDEADLAAITGGLFVHNHPPYDFPEGDPRRRAGSFSPKDLVFMWENDLAEIVTVTLERTYFLRRPAGGLYLDQGQITDAYRDYFRRVAVHLAELAAVGSISAEEADADGRLTDEVMQIMGLFYHYQWEEVVS